jgi:alkanesulfonate monooxygenase SsuD/methylene tetrahydromethanopterin reductase-like flavin-dependent oxidoreductase (luciferase family)
MLLAEELGFDAIAINEHHQTIYSMQPATSVRAGYLAALTNRVKILVAGCRSTSPGPRASPRSTRCST